MQLKKLPFLTKFTFLEMCLICLVSLTLLAIHTAELIHNIIRGTDSGTISGSLYKNSWINILKCDKSMPAVNDALYSLYEIDWETGTGTCVSWSIVPSW